MVLSGLLLALTGRGEMVVVSPCGACWGFELVMGGVGWGGPSSHFAANVAITGLFGVDVIMVVVGCYCCWAG